MEGPFREPFYQCVTYEFYTERWQEQFYTIFSLLTMFVIPLVTLIASYVCILCTIASKWHSPLDGVRSLISSSNREGEPVPSST